MSQTKKIQSDGNISIPFKWEKQPGVSKLIINSKDQIFFHNNQDFPANLPLPPSRSHQKPPPPPPPSLRSVSKKGSAKQASYEDDPFLVAFKECTKTKPSIPLQSRMDSGFGLMMIRKSWFRFSCKKYCSVRDDALVKNQVLANYE